MISAEQIRQFFFSENDRWNQIRQTFHRFPELSFEEAETANRICHLLQAWNIPFRSGVGGHGIMVEIRATNPGPCIGLRADMDALPIQEQNTCKYRSEHEGIMHACGHDVHMSCLLGALYWLKQNPHVWCGTVKALFQPGEEKLPGGATRMIEAGVLKGEPVPDFLMALHVAPELPQGHFGFRPGLYMASTDELYFKILGSGGHAAMPHRLTDPVMAAAKLILALQDIPSRLAPPDSPTVLSIGKIEAPGATNVIPSEVKLAGTFRTFGENWRNRAHEHIRSICEAVEKLNHVQIKPEIVRGYPCLENNIPLTEKAIQAAKDFAGASQIHHLELRMTAEDFAWYGHHLPIVFFRLGTSDGNESTQFPVHHPRFDVGNEAVAWGASMLAWQVVFFGKSKKLPTIG